MRIAPEPSHATSDAVLSIESKVSSERTTIDDLPGDIVRYDAMPFVEETIVTQPTTVPSMPSLSDMSMNPGRPSLSPETAPLIDHGESFFLARHGLSLIKILQHSAQQSTSIGSAVSK